jgi:hypothetical protein
MSIIIIHLLGLAPAGYLAAPDNGPEGRYTGRCSRVPKAGDDCLAVRLNAAESPVGENLRGGKRLRLRFWETQFHVLLYAPPFIAPSWWAFKVLIARGTGASHQTHDR